MIRNLYLKKNGIYALSYFLRILFYFINFYSKTKLTCFCQLVFKILIKTWYYKHVSTHCTSVKVFFIFTVVLGTKLKATTQGGSTLWQDKTPTLPYCYLVRTTTHIFHTPYFNRRIVPGRQNASNARRCRLTTVSYNTSQNIIIHTY